MLLLLESVAALLRAAGAHLRVGLVAPGAAHVGRAVMHHHVKQAALGLLLERGTARLRRGVCMCAWARMVTPPGDLTVSDLLLLLLVPQRVPGW